MKKTKILTLILSLMMILSVFCINTKVIAEELTPEDMARTDGEGEPVVTSDNIDQINEGEDIITPEDDDHNHDTSNVHEGDLYIVDNSREYVMDKVVDGNVFIVGKNVRITGSVNGSLFVCSSGKLTIDEDAYVACHVFAFAETINLKGVTFDVYLAGININVEESSIIYRDIRATSENIYISGTIGRDALLNASKVSVPDEEEKLIINGKLNYSAKNEISNIDKAYIQGGATFTKIRETEDKELNIVSNYVFSAIGTVVFDVILYMFLLFFAPNFIKKSKEYVSTKGLLALPIGLGFTVLMPLLAFICMLTGVLGGLGGLVIFVYLSALMINAFIVSVVANEFIASKINLENDNIKKVLLLLPVSFVIWAVRKLPFVGGWISAAVFLAGVGIITFYQFDKRRKSEES